MAVDWAVSDRKLYKASVAAIKRFARENPGQSVCCFFFDCDEPRYGHLSISLDTPENNVRAVKELESYAIKIRSKNLQGKITWEWAKYQLSTPLLSPFNTVSGDFEYGSTRKSSSRVGQVSGKGQIPPGGGASGRLFGVERPARHVAGGRATGRRECLRLPDAGLPIPLGVQHPRSGGGHPAPAQLAKSGRTKRYT